MKELLELVPLIGQLAKQAVPELEKLGNEAAPLYEKMADFFVDQRARSIKRYQDKHGFSREEAMILTLDDSKKLKKVLEKQGK